MGFLGRLFGRGSGLEKHAQRVANKRAQNPDRWESIQALGKIATTPPRGTDEDERAAAVAGLMERFTFYVDPSIIDGEEKDETFRWICEAGEVAVDPIRAALRNHDSLSWPLKVLEQHLSPEQILEEMFDLLETMDTEYERDPQRKIQLLSTFESKQHPRIAPACAPFLEDMNETARFHAFGAVLAQENADSVLPELREALAEEDSVRVMVRALEHFLEGSWSLEAVADQVDLPDGWVVAPDGVPKKAAPKPAPKPARAPAPSAGAPARGAPRSSTKRRRKKR